ncbi:MAG: SH3 domain-containing protein [Pseudorhodobacter sp.]
MGLSMIFKTNPHLPRPGAAFLALVLAIQAIQPVQAQVGPDYWRVIEVPFNDPLKIRSGPGTNHQVIATAANGAIFRNLGCRGVTRARWCRIETPNGATRGWVEGRYLVETAPPEASPNSTSDNEM